jgi:hypothetical protein
MAILQKSDEDEDYYVVECYASCLACANACGMVLTGAIWAGIAVAIYSTFSLPPPLFVI